MLRLDEVTFVRIVHTCPHMLKPQFKPIGFIVEPRQFLASFHGHIAAREGRGDGQDIAELVHPIANALHPQRQHRIWHRRMGDIYGITERMPELVQGVVIFFRNPFLALRVHPPG